jgi:hypothetical protein
MASPESPPVLHGKTGSLTRLPDIGRIVLAVKSATKITSREWLGKGGAIYRPAMKPN